MWEQRYSVDEYVYGKEANDFLKEHVKSIAKGKVLSLAEGEGRNAVFLAKLGYQVTAIDASLAGIEKGKKLAQEHSVDVQFIHADIVDYDLGNACWDGITSIFFPLPSAQRIALYKKVSNSLKPQGVLLIEAYTPEQVNFDTGGGKSAEMMQSKTSLQQEITGLDFELLEERHREVHEGIYHTGLGAIVQAIARKT